jgi:hypothetical protein
MISGGLALGFDEDREVEEIFAVPGWERLEDLETVGGWRDLDLNRRALLRRWLAIL